MKNIRVLVVEDSLTIRTRIVEIIDAEPDLQVVGEAGDGQTGIELCEALRPDVITLDMMLPVLSGVGVTEYVMAYCPTPILIVSASTNRGELFRTYDALSAGAIDVLEKPTCPTTNDAWDRQLVSAIKVVARIPVITHPRGRLGRIGGPGSDETGGFVPGSMADGARVVAIGASTGGPAAVLQVLRGLPSGSGPPVLVVIHIGESFGVALPEWLAEQSGRRVRYARHGEPLPAPGRGGTFMAPPGKHLVVDNGVLRLTDDPERHSCRPSVDVLFESLADAAGSRSIGCLLTGMGRDGAQGLLAIRQAGGATIAQDEATSIVFGMPGEAVRLRAARFVAPLGDVAPLIRRLTRRSRTADGSRSQLEERDR